jgi:hypothetical protein
MSVTVGCLQKKLQNIALRQGFWLSPYIKSNVKFRFSSRQEVQIIMTTTKQGPYSQQRALALYLDFPIHVFYFISSRNRLDSTPI